MVALGKTDCRLKEPMQILTSDGRLNIEVKLSIPRSGTEANEKAHVGDMPPGDQACCCFSAEQALRRVDLR